MSYLSLQMYKWGGWGGREEESRRRGNDTADYKLMYIKGIGGEAKSDKEWQGGEE